MTPSLMTSIASMTGIPEGLLNWVVGTFGAAALAQAWSFIQMPRKVAAMTEELKAQRTMFRQRVFPKLKRIEDYLIEKELRELADDEQLHPLLSLMREDQRDESDKADEQFKPKPKEPTL